MSHCNRLLSKEEKKYRKTVIFDNEIKFLQEKIDKLNLSSPLTIKKLYFDYNKTQNHRSVCLTFKEKFTYYTSNDECSRLNKWASVNIVFDGSGTKHNNLIITHIFCSGGVRYSQPEKYGGTIIDYDIKKVCDMLANEYFIWLHWSDIHVNNDINFISLKKDFNSIKSFQTINYFLNVMWKRLDIGFEGKYTKYSLTELIDNYNKQVEKNLIIDCPFADNKFPDFIKQIELTDADINRESIYG